MNGDIKLTIRYEDADDGSVIARIAEFPAAMSFGATRAEAREAVLDALRELVLSYLEQPVEQEPAEAGSEAVRIHAAVS